MSVGFGLAVVVFVFVGAISFWSTKQLVSASEWRKHTYEVLRNLDDLLSSLTDVETGERGYALTGEETYLEPYQHGSERVDQCLKEVRRLTLDNPKQQRRIQTLEPIVKSRLALADVVRATVSKSICSA